MRRDLRRRRVAEDEDRRSVGSQFNRDIGWHEAARNIGSSVGVPPFAEFLSRRESAANVNRMIRRVCDKVNVRVGKFTPDEADLVLAAGKLKIGSSGFVKRSFQAGLIDDEGGPRGIEKLMRERSDFGSSLPFGIERWGSSNGDNLPPGRDILLELLQSARRNPVAGWDDEHRIVDA